MERCCYECNIYKRSYGLGCVSDTCYHFGLRTEVLPISLLYKLFGFMSPETAWQALGKDLITVCLPGFRYSEHCSCCPCVWGGSIYDIDTARRHFNVWNSFQKYLIISIMRVPQQYTTRLKTRKLSNRTGSWGSLSLDVDLSDSFEVVARNQFWCGPRATEWLLGNTADYLWVLSLALQKPAVSDHMVFLILTSTYSKSSLLQARCHCDWGYIDTISLVLHGIPIRIHWNLKIGS